MKDKRAKASYSKTFKQKVVNQTKKERFNIPFL